MRTDADFVTRRTSPDDAIDHVGRKLRTLEQCALHRRTIRLLCPACGHLRLIDAVPLWWLFARRGWEDALPHAVAKLCCERCRDAGRIVRPRYDVTREQPDASPLPYPDEATWKRLVSRYRS